MKNDLLEFPQSVKACLWSYDASRIDLTDKIQKDLVIRNVLNRGTYEAVLWLRGTFPEADIAATITKSSSSDWNKKSLALWSLVFNATPRKIGRFA